MVTIPGVSPVFMWIGFLILIAIFLALDLGVFNKKKHVISVKEALTWTCIWIFISLCFSLFIFLEFGKTAGLQYLGGYFLEKSLSVDNIFVIFLIFASFKIRPENQHKVLFWGIIGAIILRGALILVGSSLVQKFSWILYFFGVFLIYSAVNMVFKKEKEFDIHDSWIVKLVHKIVPVSRDSTDKFFVKNEHVEVKKNWRGKITVNKIAYAVTILFVALAVIEITDVLFAFDSIPAIFGITTDPFIIFTSNIFAILGLRSLYFVVAKLHDLFVYLNYGLAFILLFIGVKMLLAEWVHISLGLSLGIVGLSLFISIWTSVAYGRKVY